ncbi:MAG: hypothetical protein L3J38_03070 [Thiomicrorhabdus sp.]|nr:hypothetical protein [Thiomicrorhabdus sp.]MCF6298917.1 hypothetical protein [Thiomicrorhabdus sp.]
MSMKLLTLDPQLCELFKKSMLAHQWVISHQDAGQTHLVGWGYEITWQKSHSSITLRYFDKQGVATAFLETSQDAVSEIQTLLHELEPDD